MVRNDEAEELESKPARRRLRLEKDLEPDERERVERAKENVGRYRSHQECVAAYLKYCDLLVELGVKPAGYTPAVHKVQKETGIPCWRTVLRCVQKAKETHHRHD